MFTMIFLDKEIYSSDICMIVVASNIKRNVLIFVRGIIDPFDSLNSKHL